MRLPQITPTSTLLTLLVVLMLSSVLYNRESLLFCERELANEVAVLERETNLKGPIKFTEVCPEARQRVEANINRWLDVILAMLIPLRPPHSPDGP
jgi:hypothetical protein